MSSNAQSQGQPLLASRAGSSVLLVVVTLGAAVLGLLDKQGPFADAGEGMFSDLVRHVPYLLVGLVSVHQRGSLRSAALWVIALNLIDKAAIGARLATFPDIAALVPASSLIVGVVTVWLVTLPMTFAMAAVSRGAWRALLMQERRATTFSALLILCALGAIAVPVTHAILGFVLISLYDVPLFTLSFSYKAVPVLHGLFIAGALVALGLAIRELVIRRNLDAWPALLVGALLAGLAAFLSFELGTFALWAG